MKNLFLTMLLVVSTLAMAADKDKPAVRTPANITTPDNYDVGYKSITLLDGGTLYSGAVMFEVDGNKYALKLTQSGSLPPMNQRIYDIILKVMAGDLRLKQIHTFDGQVVTAGDFAYKVVAAINVGMGYKPLRQ